MHFVEQARITQHRARKMLEAGLNEDAGRCAYLVSFHAAQGLIFELADKVVKTHRGVHAEYNRLAHQNPHSDPDLTGFLSQAYEYKSEADYFKTPGFAMTATEAAEAIDTAARFLAETLKLMATAGQALP